MAVCFIGIGSNLGNRRANIKLALRKLHTLRGTRIAKVSSVIETKAVGGPRHQRDFLNAAVRVETAISPHQLLRQLKSIEHTLGRTPSVRWGPRPIDLDILFYGNKIITTKTLTIPHPRVFEREFVIQPLLQVI